MNFIVNNKQVVNLDLASIKFPPTAIASILHRVSGIVIFLLLPLILYIFSLSLTSRSSFEDLKAILVCYHIKAGLWVFCSAFIYHVFAGVRHIILDFGIGEDIFTAKRSALIVIVLAIFASIFMGVFICCPI
jgi:succinate dehydrogenase / fumarate reductase cytochrome b subunit